jgi:hypothetical protein
MRHNVDWNTPSAAFFGEEAFFARTNFHFEVRA